MVVTLATNIISKEIHWLEANSNDENPKTFSISLCTIIKSSQESIKKKMSMPYSVILSGM
jgi:hypothetical protein